MRRLTPAELERGCVHPTGRITIDRFVAMMAWHDDNHVDQLKRALEGKARRRALVIRRASRSTGSKAPPWRTEEVRLCEAAPAATLHDLVGGHRLTARRA